MKMSRITETFKKLKGEGRKAFIPYIMAGDPTLKRTKELVGLLEKCGADIIELGVPFSDPLADGPTIQRAAERSLKKKTNLARVIETVKSIRRKSSIPLVLMTYFNPVYKYGAMRFVEDAAAAGIDGIIVPDLPPEEERDFIKALQAAGIDTIFLLAPTSTEDRIRLICSRARGFIYYVSITGITGAKIVIDEAMRIMIERIRGLSDNPVAVGFGIKTPAEAREAAAASDGVIVGSAIVRMCGEGASDEEIEKYVRSLRKVV